MRIAIIVDHTQVDKRRRCFWPEVLENRTEESGTEVKYELVSLLELMQDRKYFDIYKYDAVVFNWCVLDGAVMYESDRLQSIVRFYDQHFYRYVAEKGGIVVFENQPKRWHPEQRAYDVLLEGELEVLRESVPSEAEVVSVSERHQAHPLVSGIGGRIYSQYKHTLDRNNRSWSWFPEGSTSPYSLDKHHPRKMYNGGFRRWKSSWVPLLLTENGKHPVLLAKADGEGIWIVTTMYLASSNVAELVDRIVVSVRSRRDAILKYHEKQATAKRIRLAGGISLLVLVGSFMYLAARSGLLTIPLPHADTMAVQVGFSAATACGFWLLGLVARAISRWAGTTIVGWRLWASKGRVVQ